MSGLLKLSSGWQPGFNHGNEESEGLRVGFDCHRVMEVFVQPVNGSGRVGSGYRVTETSVLTAGHVVTAAPGGRAGGLPWAGMSGAALFAGPFLVGVVVVDPARFGADRVVAAPIAPLLGDGELPGLKA